jgi:hypothetical protein
VRTPCAAAAGFAEYADTRVGVLRALRQLFLEAFTPHRIIV